MTVEKLITILSKLNPKKQVFYLDEGIFPVEVNHVREYMVYDKKKREVVDLKSVDNADPERYDPVVVLEG